MAPSFLPSVVYSTVFVALLLSAPRRCSGLESLLPKFEFPKIGGLSSSSSSSSSRSVPAKTRQIETELIAAIQDEGSRLANSERIESLIEQLEQPSSAGIAEPAIAPEVYGRWRLMYTTNTDTSSPIQRKAVDTQKFPIYQDIVLEEDGSGKRLLLVKQIVQFSDTAKLSVDALASTAAYPLEELTTPRKTTGKVLGINVLGVSLVGDEAQPDPNRPNSRIDFVFDEGNFELGNGVKIPYPVPFRLPLLRDWVKGWIDITFLSNRVRISRGNKGTTFVLLKEDDDDTAL